jgi:lysophospholipase L1-like esterase
MAGCWPGNTIRYRDAYSELITNMSQQQMLVAGCSHTAGVGIDINFGWATVLSRQLNLELVNLARGSACARYVADVLIDWLAQAPTQPTLVVVQWPNPYRSMQLINQQPHFYNVNAMDEDFAQRLRLCPESFVNEWRQAVIDLNQRCQCNIINICLESLDSDVVAPAQDLLDLGITVHLDEKQPGLTWHFDSAATDGNHHSEQCHQKWADRILTLVKNAV